MRGSTCPKESTVTLQIKVKFNGTRDTGIDNGSGRTILTSITLRYRIEPSQRSELKVFEHSYTMCDWDIQT